MFNLASLGQSKSWDKIQTTDELDGWGQMIHGTNIALRFNHLCKAWHEQSSPKLSFLISLSSSLSISLYM